MFTSLPVFVPSEEESKKLVDFFEGELRDLDDRRADLHRKLKDWEKAYESLHTGPSDFPWPNSANPKTGVIQYHVDTIHALLMNVMKVNKLPFGCHTYDPTLTPLLKPCEEFLQWSAYNSKELDLWPSLEPAILEMVQFGTSVVKSVYEIRHERTRFIKNVPSEKVSKNVRKLEQKANGSGRLTAVAIMKGIRTEAMKIVERDIETASPKIIHVPLADFWFPLGYRRLQDMPWVAERFRVYSPAQLDDLAENLGWKEDAVETVRNSFAQDLATERQEHQEGDKAAGTQTTQSDVNTFYEWWHEWKFDTDPTTKERNPPKKRFCTWFHPKSKTILGGIDHPNNNNLWPYFDFHYQKRKYHFLSRGLCAILESDEAEVNAIHKQRRDAATAANTVIGKARRNSGLTTENTQLWPTKVFFMDEPEKDLIWENIGRELNIQSLIEEERTVLSQIERKTGLTEFNMGKDMGNLAKGRASATAVMAQLRENLRRFSKVLDNCRESISEMGMHTLELYQQNAPFGKIMSVLGPKGEPMEKFFMLPSEPLRGRMFVTCNVSNEVLNEEVRRQAILLTNNMLGAYYKQMIEMTTLLSNPNAPPDVKAIAMKVAGGSTVMMEEVMEAFGIRRKDELIIDTPKTFSQLSQELQMQMVKQLVNELKGKGAPIELIDTTRQPQPPAPAAAPGSPVPIPPGVSGPGAGGPNPGLIPQATPQGGPPPIPLPTP